MSYQRIVVCSPSRLVRQKIVRQIQEVDPDARVVGEAPTLEATAILTRRLSPNIVVFAGGDEAGLADAVRLIKDSTPQHTRVILMPDQAIDHVEEAAAILPRSRYTNRALSAALSRILGHISV